MVESNSRADRQTTGKARAYALLRVAEGHTESVVSRLRSKPGVVMADVIESQSGVIMVVEAVGRLMLAELTIQALASVEPLTEAMHLMPAEEQGASMALG